MKRSCSDNSPSHNANLTLPGILEYDASCMQLVGEWTLAHYEEIASRVEAPSRLPTQLDASGLTALDTAGATLLVHLLGAETLRDILGNSQGLSDERRALLQAVAQTMGDQEPAPTRPAWRPGDRLATLGRHTADATRQVLLFLNFFGQTLLTLISLIPRPHRWRVTALIAQMHQAGFNAVPIVLLLNFLIGAVVAFLGATVLESFGATIYTVDLVSYAFMRELGVLLVAILLAGRTASAYTAELGSMKVNEELDALSVQGLNAIELLVIPRLLALLIMLPLLTFLGVLAGLVGGAMVSLLRLDISLSQFLVIVQEIPVHHLFLGLSKAPVFAVLIALIGCLEGFKVGGSARSVGIHTTSAVVQSIFMVILLDAVAALFFMEMGW